MPCAASGTKRRRALSQAAEAVNDLFRSLLLAASNRLAGNLKIIGPTVNTADALSLQFIHPPRAGHRMWRLWPDGVLIV
jgi:hypothetical protein